MYLFTIFRWNPIFAESKFHTNLNILEFKVILLYMNECRVILALIYNRKKYVCIKKNNLAKVIRK